MLKALIVSSVAIPLFGGIAFAADLPAGTLDTASSPAATVFDWTGAYVGVIGGGGGSNVDWTYVANDSTADHDGSGVLGGLEAGYNYQFGNWVMGVAGDVAGSDISGNTSCPNPTFTCNSKINFLGSLRGRVGFGINRLFVYGTGGLAVGTLDINTERAGVETGTTKTRVGWTAGAGMEYAFSDRLSAKVEYRYIDLGSSDFEVDGGLHVNAHTTANIGLIGLNYKF